MVMVRDFMNCRGDPLVSMDNTIPLNWFGSPSGYVGATRLHQWTTRFHSIESGRPQLNHLEMILGASLAPLQNRYAYGFKRWTYS
jgi:hypothetical protein